MTIETTEPNISGLCRRQTLTNSAAEFVETRAGMEIVAQIIPDGLDELDDLKASSEFVPELDQFVPKGVKVDPYYQESQKRMAIFQQTLHSFVRLLRERNVDKELNVVIKDPGDLTMQDALAIISKIQDGRDPKHVRSCKSFIQRCYRKAESNRGVVEAIVSLLPTDSYGSVISGGFILILAAVEKHEKHRQAMQKFLAEIPEQLERIQRWSQLHVNSLRVHAQRDAVLVSIFVVLERIVHQLTQTWTGKVKAKLAKGFFGASKSRALAVNVDTQITSSGSENKKNVTDALHDLEKQVNIFQEEIGFADSERLGRVEGSNIILKHDMVTVVGENREMFEQARIWTEKLMGGFFNEIQKSQDEVYMLLNKIYRFHTSDAMFDTRTGQVNYEEIERLRLSRLIEAPRSFQESNQAIVSAWLGKIKTSGFDHTCDDDMRDCLSQLETFEPDEKDQIQFIISSEEMSKWLQSPKTSFLQLDLQTPPTSLGDALSFTCARLAAALRSFEKHPTLSFFCKHRNTASSSQNKSGPVALIRSINGQLLEFIMKHKQGLDLSQLNQSFLAIAGNDTRTGLKLFRALLILLEKEEEEKKSDSAVVFLILDSLSSLSGKSKDSHEMIEILWNIIQGREKLIIKILVTDPLANSPVSGIATISLLVPDLVNVTGAMDSYGETGKRIEARLEEAKNTPPKKKGRRKGKSRRVLSDSEEEDD